MKIFYKIIVFIAGLVVVSAICYIIVKILMALDELGIVGQNVLLISVIILVVYYKKEKNKDKHGD